MVFAFASFVVVAFAALASPGPAFLAMVHQTQNRSRRACLFFAAGLGFIATFWCALALFGLTAVFDFFPWAYTALKLLGGAYLVYLAIRMWRTADQPLADKAPSLRADRWAFLQGCMVNLANPKSVLFAASVLLTIFPPDLAWPTKLAILGVLFSCEMSFYTALTFGLNRPRVRQAYLRAKSRIDRIAGAILGALGLNLIITRN